MANEPTFAIIGQQPNYIDVRLSYKIVELFSEGLYSSPNKAIAVYHGAGSEGFLRSSTTVSVRARSVGPIRVL